MRDYCDGEEFKSHPLFSVNIRALQIIIYYDDVEICNPLGSRRTVHKIGMDACCGTNNCAALQINDNYH